MGKVTSLINSSTDGSVDGQFAKADAEYNEFWHGLLKDTKTVVFGRNTFELFQNLQTSRLENENTPEWQMRMARVLTDMPKLVYSSSLKTTTWNNSTILPKVDAEFVNSYKKEGKGRLHIIGSPSLIAEFTKMNLIDEYYFCFQPVIAGGGGNVRLFDSIKLNTQHPLRLKSTKVLQSGVVIIHYERAG